MKHSELSFETRQKLMQAALQQIPCDLTIKNIQLVNVFTGEIYPAEVDILDGFIVRVRTENETTEVPSKDSYDGQNKYLIPGFIDSHVHIESTMMIPENFSRAVLPWGTTTVCTDPHEIGNVLGIDGVKFMQENSEKSALRQFILAPSSVPSVPGVEGNGAAFFKEEIAEILDLPNVIGIAEVMDFMGVLKQDDRMSGILQYALENDVFIQGHAPTLTGKELIAYILAGPRSDHESMYSKEVVEKLRNGMYVNIRASSYVDVVPALMEECKNHKWRDLVSICTDDIHAHSLLTEGHINKTVARVIASGIDPVEAIKMATFNVAREYGFKELGAIAPGYLADMQIVDKLDGGMPRVVFASGKLVAKDGEYVANEKMTDFDILPNVMNLPDIKDASDLMISVDSDKNEIDVLALKPTAPGSVFMTTEEMKVSAKDGFIDISGNDDVAYICVCNRYGSGDYTVALIKDFGITHGAFATTISHDSHNLIVIYKDAEDGLDAIRELERCGGGVTAIENRKPMYTLELPVAGLMSTLPCKELAHEVDLVTQAARKITGENATVLQASLFSLPCIPGVVVTDKTIINGMTQEKLSVII